jgi:selenocysteine lyase/cysteine desulfurase
MKKRDFVKNMGSIALGMPLMLTRLPNTHFNKPNDYPLNDDEFWKRIREDYHLTKEYINLESGYYNIIPQPTLKKFMAHIQQVNIEGAHYMRTVQWNNKSRVAKKLAQLVGCSSEELIITRNTTESLDLVIGGFPWKKGDEVIYAHQDYGAMQNMFEQVANRHGVVNKVISIPNSNYSDEEIVALYENQITPKTKLIMVCHMVNITGQILPVQKICDMAHSYGVQVMVDGAHCVGHIDVNIEKLHCDYYGSSLHKWLAAPLGAGLLYIRNKHISKIWPLLADHRTNPNDILRLNHTGTHPVHTDLAIENAIEYLEIIGIERKEKRLRFLQKYWTDKLRTVNNININTPVEPHRSCAIANVGVKGLTGTELAKILMDEYQIFTVGIDGADAIGCRITPNVFTTTKELDIFVKAMIAIAKKAK